LPLLNRQRCLGVLGLSSRTEKTFTEQHLPLLRRAAYQVAVAVGDPRCYQRLLECTEKLQQKSLSSRGSGLNELHNLSNVIGESDGLHGVLRQVQAVGPTDATVLLLGETGTGKELIARTIHLVSGRRSGPFVEASCTAVPGDLIESELFGYEKGAFTGAFSRKLGRFDLAQQGTLFLDEVGDIPLGLQAKLLRALQEREFKRLGGTQAIPADLRVVAATNCNLARMVRTRQFRMDLYYRLNVFPIMIPPLRNRREDIPLLVRHFVRKYAALFDKQIEVISAASMDCLVGWRWPGNIRELENVIERSAILSPGAELILAELGTDLPVEGVGAETKTLAEIEREHIVHVLHNTRGVIGGSKGAATRLGMKRTTLNAKMRKLGISRADL
jgi:formate hydrogenlyase transcriptional activator